MILSFLKKFDLLGAKPSLKINNDKSYTTIIGVLLTLICVALSISSIYSTFLDFVNKSNATITSTLSYDTDSHLINSENFDFMVYFLSFDPKSFLAKPIPYNAISMPPLLAYQTIMGRNHIVSNSTFMSECDKNKYSNDPNISPFISYYCVPKNYSFTINSTANDAGAPVYSITLLPEYYTNITNTYPYFIINLKYKKLVLQADNFTNPYTYKWTDFSIILQPNHGSMYQHIVQNSVLNIIDPSFIFQVARPTDSYLLSLDPVMIFSSVIQNSDIGVIPPFQIQFVKSLNVINYTISYVQFDAVVSTFGATFNVFYFVFSAVYTFFCENFVKVFLINHVFKFHSYSRDEDKIKKIKSKIKKILDSNNIISNHNYNHIEEDNKEIISINTNLNNIKVYEIKGENKSINNFVSTNRNSEYKNQNKLSFTKINDYDKEGLFYNNISYLKEFRKDIGYSSKKHFLNEIWCFKHKKEAHNYHLLNNVIESTLSYERILQMHFDLFQIKQLLRTFSKSKHGLENPSLNMDDNEYTTEYLKNLLEKNMYDWTSDEVIKEVDDNNCDFYLKKYFIQSWS